MLKDLALLCFLAATVYGWEPPRPAYALKTKEEILAALFNPPIAAAPRHAPQPAAAPPGLRGFQSLFQRTREWFKLSGRSVKPADAR
jgi:hypothetical protein